MSDTPETDAVYPPDIIDREFKAQGRTYGWGTLHDMRESSRSLERQRDDYAETLRDLLNFAYEREREYIRERHPELAGNVQSPPTGGKEA